MKTRISIGAHEDTLSMEDMLVTTSVEYTDINIHPDTIEEWWQVWARIGEPEIRHEMHQLYALKMITEAPYVSIQLFAPIGVTANELCDHRMNINQEKKP